MFIIFQYRVKKKEQYEIDFSIFEIQWHLIIVALLILGLWLDMKFPY